MPTVCMAAPILANYFDIQMGFSDLDIKCKHSAVTLCFKCIKNIPHYKE